MSRIGKQPISLHSDVKVSFAGDELTVEGPKGKLVQKIDPLIELEIGEKEITCTQKNPNDDRSRSRFGLTRSLVSNMIEGCHGGFKKELEVIGVGFRANVQGNTLDLALGFSHGINFPIPDGITITVEKLTKIIIEGADRQKVGQVAAEIRTMRPPEPYKGKGVKYADETIIRKAGKSAAS